jgi:pepF/M3 family oligoendopeptidase
MSNENKLTWDLQSVFPGGSESTEFADFRKAIRLDIEKAKKTLADMPRKLDQDTSDKWVAFLLLVQLLMERIDHAFGFTGCLTDQDVTDDKARLIQDEIDTMQAQLEVLMTGIEELAIKSEDSEWEKLVGHDKLKGAAFWWNEVRHHAKLKMPPELEKLATELAVNGYHSWNRLYNRVAGDLQAEFVEDGKTEVLSMGQLANKFSSPDRKLRKQAFDKLSETWKSVDTLAAMALNSQAGFRLSLYKNRNWESPLFEPLLNGRLKRETIDAMWSAVAKGGKKISEYTTAKTRLLGIDKFRWYDQVAPISAVEKKISYEEAGNFVVEQLSSFSPDLGSFARTVLDRRWIEAEDRPGKAAGGWCTGLPLINESRIFMTFSGNYQEIMTLAHEIGHAYHSWVLRDHDYFASQYNMNLAETASTFNEHLVTDAALNAAEDKGDKLSLLDTKLQEGFGMFCDLRSRFLFDMAFYEERKKGTVPKERLGELMIEAQKEAFGDILADDGYHPLFWASKLHFFETETPFYNFPYTFGYLFAGGLYDMAQKEGTAFADPYKAMLADTGSMMTEEVAKKHLGVDLTDEKFWNGAVGRVLSDIEPFKKLTEEMSQKG